MQSTSVKQLKIGTRGSPLALCQANMVKNALRALSSDLLCEIVVIKTSGDWKPEDGETRLSEEQGGKGLFAKEIEQALLDGIIDIAVHSMKDMESFLPEGLVIPWMLPREDARDAMITSPKLSGVRAIKDLPHDAVIGTASVRRGAFLLAQRPDLKIVPLRGNVQTRLEKLKRGQVDATLLAVAGLNRLGLQNEISFIIEEQDMLPAAAQGAIGIECLEDRRKDLSFIDQISNKITMCCVTAEREMLRILDGSCHTPIGAHATLCADGTMTLKGQLCALNGSLIIEGRETAKISSITEASALGRRVGEDIKSRASADLLT